MDEHTATLVGSYNKTHAGEFGKRKASRKFLGPWKLYMAKSPPPEFGSNQVRLTRDEESSLFKAMHFIRFRIVHATNQRNFRRYLAIYLALRNRAISSNWRLVPAAVARKSRGFFDLDLLESVGNRSLIDAVKNFDPWRGFRFSTYACNAIHRRMWKTMTTTFKKNRRLSTEQIPEIQAEVEDETEALWLDRLMQLLRGANLLSRQEADVLYLRFWKNMTLRKAGKEMSVSPERARQVQENAISKLRKIMMEDCLLNPDAIQYSLLEEHISRRSA